MQVWHRIKLLRQEKLMGFQTHQSDAGTRTVDESTKPIKARGAVRFALFSAHQYISTNLWSLRFVIFAVCSLTAWGAGRLFSLRGL